MVDRFLGVLDPAWKRERGGGKIKRDAALATNAEMRAALEAAYAIHQRCECAAPPCTCTGFEAARDALSRTDLGAGVVVVPREVVERVCERLRRSLPMLGPRHGAWSDDSKEAAVLLADLDALLGKEKP